MIERIKANLHAVSASSPAETSASAAPRVPERLRDLGLYEIYEKKPALLRLFNLTWLDNGDLDYYLKIRSENGNFLTRHTFSAEELAAPKVIVRDVPEFLKQPGSREKYGLMVDFQAQIPNPPQHPLPIAQNFQETCHQLNLLGDGFWWTCKKSPEECAKNMPATTHILVTAIYNSLVEPGWCHGDVPGNVFTPSHSFYYQYWTFRISCYQNPVQIPANLDWNGPGVEYHPQLINSLNVYAAAPGHFVPQQLPRVIRMLLTVPVEAKLLVAHSGQTEQLMEILIERGLLTKDRIVWWQSGKAYMGGIVYQSHAWPFNENFRYLHDRTDMQTVHEAMVDDLPDNERDTILIVHRGSGSRALSNHDAVVSATQALLDEMKKNFPQSANTLYNLKIEIFTAAGHVRDHLKLFRQSQIVIAPHGAGLANVFFCKPNATSVLEIGYKTGMPLPEMYFEMASHTDLDYYLVKGDGDYSSQITADLGDFQWALRKALEKIQQRADEQTANGKGKS